MLGTSSDNIRRHMNERIYSMNSDLQNVFHQILITSIAEIQQISIRLSLPGECGQWGKVEVNNDLFTGTTL